jgi:Phage integrase, N-terminal SAM-like domain
MKRNRRAGVEDRWHKTARDEQGNRQKVPSVRHGKGMRWMARYVDDRGREHAKGFDRKSDAQAWLDQQTAALVGGTHVVPRHAALTVAQWCELWLEGYAVRRESTVAQARVHIRQIVAEFGSMPLTALRPSQVKSWVAKLHGKATAEYRPFQGADYP